MTLDRPFRSARQLAAEIRAKKIGCRELLELYLARVAKHNPTLNAIVVLDAEGARKRADAADRALARKRVWGPLHGVPMTIKESYDVAGLPTTWGIPAAKDNRPTQNAITVDRLLDAGVVLFGKTNVPIWLADYQSYNDIYGVTNNPWDLTRTPGGSSGGSAAALAAGLTGLDAGTDIGSSIRNPAHFCGIFGHKPTYGIVPYTGQGFGRVAPGDITVAGPMARSAGDLAIALDAMAGPDEIDGAGWRLRLPLPRRKTLREYRVAIVVDEPTAEVDAEVQARLAALAEFLGRRRVKVSDTARPDIDTARLHQVYIQLLRAATSGRQTPAEFARNAETARGLAPDDHSYYARMMRANTMAHRDWLAVNEERHRLRRKWARFFEEWDLLLCPVASTAAFPHDHVGERYERTIIVNGRRVPTTDQLFWAGYSGVAFLPATVAPIGLTPGGLPVGVQIVGPQHGDRTCIAFAQHLEREFQAFVPPPGYE